MKIKGEEYNNKSLFLVNICNHHCDLVVMKISSRNLGLKIDKKEFEQVGISFISTKLECN